MRSVAPSAPSPSPSPPPSRGRDPSTRGFRGRGFPFGGRGWGRGSARGFRRPGSLSLDVPSADPFDPSAAAASGNSPAAAAVSNSHSPSGADRSPSRSPGGGRGGGASSFVSYLRSHVKLPQCPMAAAAAASSFIERPTLAGALKQQTADNESPQQHSVQQAAPMAETNNSRAAEESNMSNISAGNSSSHPPPQPLQHQPQPHSHLHPYLTPYARSFHPPLHRGSLPLPLSVSTAASLAAPLSAHPLSIGGPWQPVSRSIPIAHQQPGPLASAPSLVPSFFSNASSSLSSSSSSFSSSPVPFRLRPPSLSVRQHEAERSEPQLLSASASHIAIAQSAVARLPIVHRLHVFVTVPLAAVVIL